MADHAFTSGTPPSENGAAIISEQLTALLLKDEGRYEAPISPILSTPPSNLEALHMKDHGKHATPPTHRRLLFTSVREALENSGQLKEEPGGYVIKRHSGRQQQQFRSADKAKNRQAKQRSNSKSDMTPASSNPVENVPDAAGYTVIRRRSSCDESISSASVPATAAITGRRNYRPSTPARKNTKKTQQPAQRPRRGSMSALSQRSSLQTSMKPPPSSSVPPGFQPYSASNILHPPSNITSAASGWVVKAAAPAQNTKKIEELPVEALWPGMEATSATNNGWTVTTTTSSTDASDLLTQTWVTTTDLTVADQTDDDDDDLLARLGVTL